MTKEEWNKYKDLEHYPDRVCVCGCGGRIKVRSSHKYNGIPKYIHGHQNVGRPSPRKGKTYEELYGIEKAIVHSAIQKIAQNRPEANEKRSASLRAAYTCPEIRNQLSVAMTNVANSSETKEKQRIANSRPETKAKRSASAKAVMLKLWATVAGREKMLEALTCPAALVKLYEAHNCPEAIANHRAAQKRNWQNPDYVAKMLVCNGMLPNKPEKFLIKLFQELFPNQWKYVGDGSFWLTSNGRHLNPDFIHVSQKKIIEHFGDYHHGEKKTGIPNEQHEQERIDLLAQHGYQTLVIWEHELKDKEILKDKLIKFTLF